MVKTSEINPNFGQIGLRTSEYGKIVNAEDQAQEIMDIYKELHTTLNKGKEMFIPHEEIPGVLKRA